jgi:hypothetical protein
MNERQKEIQRQFGGSNSSMKKQVTPIPNKYKVSSDFNSSNKTSSSSPGKLQGLKTIISMYQGGENDIVESTETEVRTYSNTQA